MSKIKLCPYCDKGTITLKFIKGVTSHKCDHCDGSGIITQEDRLKKRQSIIDNNKRKH